MRFFELLARPRDAAGREYQAAECIGALDASGLRAEFDALMLLRSVQQVRKLESRARNAGFFLNLSPAMLARIETFNQLQSGRAHVRTPVPTAHLVCHLLLEKSNNKSQISATPR